MNLRLIAGLLLGLVTFGPVFAIQSSQTTAWSLSSLILPADLAGTDPSDISIDRIFFSQTGEGWVGLTIGPYPPVFDGLARSLDGGVSWQLLPPVVGYRHIDSVFFLDAKQGWASTNTSGVSSATVLHTTDGGQKWERWSSLESLKVRALLDIHFHNDGNGVAVGFLMPGQTGVILRTTDFGKTWMLEKTTDQTLYRLARAGNNAWALGYGLILQSTRGQPWKTSHRRPGPDLIWGIDAPSEELVVANTYNGKVVRSEDGGQTWEVVTLPAPYDHWFIGPVRFSDARLGWIAGHQGVVLSTKDGGKTWGFETQLKSYFIRDVAVTSSKVFVVGDDGLIGWRSRPK